MWSFILFTTCCTIKNFATSLVGEYVIGFITFKIAKIITLLAVITGCCKGHFVRVFAKCETQVEVYVLAGYDPKPTEIKMLWVSSPLQYKMTKTQILKMVCIIKLFLLFYSILVYASIWIDRTTVCPSFYHLLPTWDWLIEVTDSWENPHISQLSQTMQFLTGDCTLSDQSVRLCK